MGEGLGPRDSWRRSPTLSPLPLFFPARGDPSGHLQGVVFGLTLGGSREGDGEGLPLWAWPVPVREAEHVALGELRFLLLSLSLSLLLLSRTLSTSFLCGVGGSALGGRGCSSLQDLGDSVPASPPLQPPRLHRALRRLGGRWGCLGPSGGDLGSPAPPTPRTRWYYPVPSQVRNPHPKARCRG